MPYVWPIHRLTSRMVVDWKSFPPCKLKPFSLVWPRRVSTGFNIVTLTTASGLGTVKSSSYFIRRISRQSSATLTDAYELRNHHPGNVFREHGPLPLVLFDHSAMVVIPFELGALEDNGTVFWYFEKTGTGGVNGVLGNKNTMWRQSVTADNVHYY